jgi:UPF0716 family protein affecting phage T7 exclusion
VAIAGALNLLVPGIYSDAIGFAVLVGIHLIQVRKARSLDNPAVSG